MLKDIRNLFNGAVYGTILVIPGVSATLFAIILKFYDELIEVVNHFGENYRKNARYAGVFLLGIAAGAVGISSLIVFLLDHFSFPTMLFFTGLLAGMIPLIARKAKGKSPWFAPGKIALALVALLALLAGSSAVAATTLSPSDALAGMNLSLTLYILLAGIINGATLVIPGLSGAFILLIMGLYPLIVFSISSIGTFFADFGNLPLLRDIAVVLLPFGAGGIIGFLAMARVMEKLLRNFQEAVYAVILGLLLGSIAALFQDHLVIDPSASVLYHASGAVMFCAGCAAAYMLGKRE